MACRQPDMAPGHIAYARKKAAMYDRMEIECKGRFDQAGYRDLRLRLEAGEHLSDLLSAARSSQEISQTSGTSCIVLVQSIGFNPVLSRGLIQLSAP